MKNLGGRLFSVIFGLLLVSNLLQIEIYANTSINNDKKTTTAHKNDKSNDTALARLPISFEENKGQSDKNVKFLLRKG